MPKYTDADLDKIFDDIYTRIETLEAKMDVITECLTTISSLLKREDR